MSLSPTRTRQLLKIMNELLSYRISLMFSEPVDPERDGCPDYLDKIKHPMDLGTIVNKLNDGAYHTVAEWRNDVHQVWENAYTYNRRNSLVGILAQQLDSFFQKLTEFVTEDEKADWMNKMYDLRNKLNAARQAPPKHLIPPKSSKKQGEIVASKGTKVQRTNSQNGKKDKDKEKKQLQRTMSHRPPPKQFTQDEIVELTEDVNSIAEEHMDAIIKLIKKYEPELMQDGGEVEIDVNKLKLETLLGLRALVNRLRA